MDSFFCLKPTPYGGRGLYAVKAIPKDTLLITCDAPYAAVISRKFRKEVCSHCFAYAFDSRRNAWNIRYTAQEGSGVWFCSEGCRDLWAVEQNVGGLQGLMNAAIEKLAKAMKKPKADEPPSLTETMRPEDITLEFHDLVWKRAEKIYSRSGYQTPYLDEMELDVVRFVVYAIIRRHLEDTTPLPSKTSSTGLDWQGFLKLQNNEVMCVRSGPYMLDSYIRVYGFLRKVLLPALQGYVESSETVRAILARDPGNVFGLWDMSIKGDSEMLGWSMYVGGSYFNHGSSSALLGAEVYEVPELQIDCAPNVRKERNKRALCFFTKRDVAVGEELCINYIDLQDEVAQRRAQLLKNWYFDCFCKRCSEELSNLM